MTTPTHSDKAWTDKGGHVTSAAHQNDEVLLVIHSPLLAAHFTREIDRLWKGAELGISDRLARKLQRGRERCGSGAERGS